MKTFSYVARDISGQSQNGYSKALNKNDVMVWLRDQGLIPVDVRVYDLSNQSAKKVFSRKRVKSIEISSFCWQLHAMIDGGVSITSAMETIAEDCDNPYFQCLINQVSESIEQGETFSSSVAKFPKVFNKMFCSMVMAGESGGSLPNAMKSLAEFFDSKDKLARKIKSAMAYPAFVIGFIIILMVFIMTFIIPRFQTLFADIGGELPAITRWFMAFYGFVSGNIVYILILMIGAIVGCVFYCNSKLGRGVYSRFVLKVPLIGKIISQGFIVMFCRTFSTLLSAGVSVLDALELLSTMSNNTVISSAITMARSQIVEGSGISLGMSTSKFFPKLLVKMVQVGEESGSLSNILDRTSIYYERKVETTIATIMSVLEPILIVSVGMIVLVIVLALYLPIFSLSDIKQ
ncbi:MAG: type II secretion system F family protein [Phycisphaerae bacterium]|nr:type II secretion system F family protein [Phycisphaerae bacterium]